MTEGGTAWDLIRDPTKSYKIVNAIIDYASNFLEAIERIFDSNELIKAILPEYVPTNKNKDWNAHRMVLPNRKVGRREANIEIGGIGGAAEGKHYDGLKVDDMFGLKALNAMKQSGAEMVKSKNWFKTNTATLLNGPDRCPIWVSGTRWAIDDGYDDIFRDSKVFAGTNPENYKLAEDGIWNVFFKRAIEDGVPIFPEDFSLVFYDKLKKDDWWTYITSFMNSPQDSGLAEFSAYDLKKCYLDYDKDNGFIIGYSGSEPILLSSCNVIIACDPAASEFYVTARTSQSAVIVLATAPDGKQFVINIKADYVPVSTMFSWLFHFAEIYSGYFNQTVMELQGPFKLLGPMLREKELERREEALREGKKPINLMVNGVGKLGNKDSVIRSNLEPCLQAGKLYCESTVYDLLYEQIMGFPQSTKKDILDAVSLGVQSNYKPRNEEEIARKKNRVNKFKRRRVNVAGY